MNTPDRRRQLMFNVEEVEALCQQATLQANERAREELEWMLRLEMARATQIAEEAYKLRSRLSALIEVGTDLPALRAAVLRRNRPSA
jgi:hypothetical protein